MMDTDVLSLSISNSSFDEDEKPHSEMIALPVVDKETKRVCCIRTTMIVVMSIVTLVMSFTTFYTVRRAEDDIFSRTYRDHATKVIESFQYNVDQKLRAIDGFGIALTSFASFKNETWPYVTLSDFAIRGASMRALTESAVLGFLPLVTDDNRAAWEEYSTNNLVWVTQGLEFEHGMEERGTSYKSSPSNSTTTTTTIVDNGKRILVQDEENSDLLNISDTIFNLDRHFERVPSESAEHYIPIWQIAPVVPELINLNLGAQREFRDGMEAALESRRAVIGKSWDTSKRSEVFRILETHWTEEGMSSHNDPVSEMVIPVFREVNAMDPNNEIVGLLTSVIFWKTYLIDSLPPGAPGVITIIQNECKQAYSYRIDGGDTVEYLGEGDLHDPIYDRFEKKGPIVSDKKSRTGRFTLNKDFCAVTIRVYPTDEFFYVYHSSRAVLLMCAVIFVLALTAVLLCLYDVIIERRQQMIIEKAAKADDIVSSLFPAHVRDRLYKENHEKTKKPVEVGVNGENDIMAAGRAMFGGSAFGPTAGTSPLLAPPPSPGGMRSTSGNQPADEYQANVTGKPIAELFPETTVFFAEIVGFIPWSSMREPSEVFTLLQTLFQCFDTIAKKLSVFKVETVGESYVAVTGLPEPQQDHAVRMARFARECMHRFHGLMRSLEVQLGPDTGDLQLKVGLHSGPVTAGVLRGAKSRFQLFGDTVNTAARMESTSEPDCIQCSNSAADLIAFSGKEAWLRERPEGVKAKGKGVIQTYFILPRNATDEGDVSYGSDIDDTDEPFGFVVDMSAHMNEKQRLIDWQVELLSQQLKRLEAHRLRFEMKKKKKVKKDPEVNFEFKEGSTAIDEVTEVIKLPSLKHSRAKHEDSIDEEHIELDLPVLAQLKDYVTTIASMYRDNAFHNFEHATHVTMSTNKLMKRVVSPADAEEMDLHEYTGGITSNPLTQFALLFCALIHDVDHAGVSNFQLIKEQAPIAQLYRHRSVAEQNSVDISWDLLMDPTYVDLRNAIYSNEDEMKHFRQLVVNIVLATDIFDKHMKEIREKRWDKAFQYEDEFTDKKKFLPRPEGIIEPGEQETIYGLNLKATVVMEHLIQASDVAHTMQHWEIYLKWNERLFQEMTYAFEQGRAPKEPAAVWYEGEIIFFDKYILPLARKLADCGVFGVSSDECLNYAMQNRTLWAAKGDEIVERFKKNYSTKDVRKRKRSNVSVSSS